MGNPDLIAQALAEEEAGRLHGATALYRQAIAAAAAAGETDKALLLHVHLGQLAMREEEFEAALDHFMAAHLLNPVDPHG